MFRWLRQFTQSPDGLCWGAYEDGQAFIAGVLAKIPDETLRAQAKAAFEATAAKDAVTLIGDGVLARADYSKHMDAITTKDRELKEQLSAANTLYERNDTWYKANEAALKAYPTLKAENDRLKAGGEGETEEEKAERLRRSSAGGIMTKDEIAKLITESLDPLLAERERGYVDVVAFMQDTGMTHLGRFGTAPNMRELIANPKLGKPIVGQPGRVFSLQDAYNEKYGADVAAKDKEAHDKLIEDEVQKRLKQEREQNPGLQAFPLRGQAPSVLDVLTTKDGSAAHTLDTAVAAYESLQSGRGV